MTVLLEKRQVLHEALVKLQQEHEERMKDMVGMTDDHRHVCSIVMALSDCIVDLTAAMSAAHQNGCNIPAFQQFIREAAEAAKRDIQAVQAEHAAKKARN